MCSFIAHWSQSVVYRLSGTASKTNLVLRPFSREGCRAGSLRTSELTAYAPHPSSPQMITGISSHCFGRVCIVYRRQTQRGICRQTPLSPRHRANIRLRHIAAVVGKSQCCFVSDGVHIGSEGMTSGCSGHRPSLPRTGASSVFWCRSAASADTLRTSSLASSTSRLSLPLPCSRTASLAAPMSAECLPCLSDGAVWQMLPAVSFLCLEVLGE